jgi:hypothetical protein
MRQPATALQRLPRQQPARCAAWQRAAIVVLVALAACGTDGSDREGADSSAESEAAPSRTADTVTTTASTTTASTTTASTTIETGYAEPSTLPDATTTTATDSPALELVAAPEGVAAVVELGYPRDLLERGRVNVVITNDSDVTLLISSRELVADAFESPGSEVRRSTIPAGRNRMALQALFGEVTDCSTTESVSATFVLTYTTSEDPAPRRSSLPIADAAILDGIRGQTCAARHVHEVIDISFDNVVVDGESITTDAVLTRISGNESFTITAIVGTVLFGAASALPADVAPRVLAADEATVTVPLVFDVNRCDSHAVAETTKKFGLDFWISVDGAAEQRIPIVIDDLLDEFATILERCKSRIEQD